MKTKSLMKNTAMTIAAIVAVPVTMTIILAAIPLLTATNWLMERVTVPMVDHLYRIVKS